VKIAESAGHIDMMIVIKNPCGFIGPSGVPPANSVSTLRSLRACCELGAI
jgi:hypothetical protein